MDMPDTGQRIRAFVAVDVSPEFRAAAAKLQALLQEGLPRDAVRWTAVEQIHLTLKFLGHVPAAYVVSMETALEQACTGLHPFQLYASGVGAFPTLRNARVIWIGLAGELEVLLQLQGAVDRLTAPFAAHEENRGFRPHVTLGRLREKSDRHRRTLGELLTRAVLTTVPPWRVDCVKLMQSKLARSGAEYHLLKAVPLQSPDPEAI